MAPQKYPTRKIRTGVSTVLVFCAAAIPGRAVGGETNQVTFLASAALKEAYDSNVYLQSYTDSAEEGSFVTSASAQITMAWKPSAAFHAALTYAPEQTFFHSAPGENNTLHRVAANLDGAIGRTQYDFANTLVGIDGDHLGPTWNGPGGAPAAGAPAIRDRRDAVFFRSGLKVASAFGPWIVRPVASGYFHDFRAEHHATGGYQNYVDRNEYTAGLDLGRRVWPEANGFLGYRFGAQDQAKLLQYPEEYDSDFHRLLLGLEGKLGPMVKTEISFGPEFREFGERVPAAFGHKDRVNIFADASVSVTPSPAEIVKLCIRNFEQPGFSGRSTYTDLTIDLCWKHTFQEITIGAAGRAYSTEFRTPVQRDDWIYSANGFLNYSWSKALSTELSYAYEEGHSEIPGNEGREYVRHVVALGLKYAIASPHP